MLHLAIRPLALGSFIGGPLALAKDLGFVPTFAPIMALIIGALVVGEGHRGMGTRIAAGMGVLGAVALVGMDLVVCVRLLRGDPIELASMIVIGIVVSLVTVGLYLRLAVPILTQAT